MSECIKDGGPAFPEAIAVSPAGDVYPGMGGMSLRDYFAAMAVSGHLASCNAGSIDQWFAKYLAETGYMVADTMLKAREAQP